MDGRYDVRKGGAVCEAGELVPAVRVELTEAGGGAAHDLARERTAGLVPSVHCPVCGGAFRCAWQGSKKAAYKVKLSPANFLAHLVAVHPDAYDAGNRNAAQQQRLDS